MTLAVVQSTIEDGEPMLTWDDDWDMENSRKPSKVSWDRAVKFLTAYAERVHPTRSTEDDDIELLPSRDGKVAIDWRLPNTRKLLMSFPEHGYCSYFGHDSEDNHRIKGTIDPEQEHEWLVDWLSAA